MMKVALTLLFVIMGVCGMNAGNLIKDGSLDLWSDGTPSGGWLCERVEKNREFAESGETALFRPLKKSNAVLRSPEISLKPSTKYILSFYYRVPDDNSGIRGYIEGIKGAAFAFDIPYIHREGIRVEHIFTTPEKIPAKTRIKFIAGRNGLAIIDEVSLTPYKTAWNRPVFMKKQNGEAVCSFTIGNIKAKQNKFEVEAVIYDFYNNPLWSKKADFSLNGDGERAFSAKFATGDSRYYRAVLKYTRGDGFKDEIWSYLNMDVTKGIRKRYELTDKNWLFGKATVKGDKSTVKLKAVSIPNSIRRQKGDKPIDFDYRLDYELPSTLKASEKLFFIANSALLNPRVYINGELAGSAVGRMPLEVDITKFWKTGIKNKMVIRVSSHQAESFKKKDGGTHWQLPHGAHVAGLMDSVVLETRPINRTEMIKIETSLKKHELTVKGRLINDSTQPGWYTVESTVLGENKKIVKTNSEKFWLVPFEPMVFKLSSSWKNPHLYFPHDPYLYTLQTVVKNAQGKVVDKKLSRFGFREITIKGKHVFINGKKAKFTSRLSAPRPSHNYRVHPKSLDESMDREFRSFQQYIRLGIVYGREYPFMGRMPIFRMGICDELGFMLRSSFELNMAYTNMNDTYDDTPAFWDASRRYIEESMRRLWNHPSIIEWDMENETFLCSTQHTFPKLYDEFDRLRRVARANDSTRPILHDSADPMGDSDIISLHYPIEITRHFPPSPVFPYVPFERGKLYTQLNLHPGAFVWNEKRPLMLGEDLIDLREFPQSLSLFFDDEIYGQVKRRNAFDPQFTLDNYRRTNYMLQMLGRAYRQREVHVLTGWACSIELFKDELARDAIVVDQYQQHFRSGEKVKRSFSYFHDPMNDFKALIAWRLKDDTGKTLDKGETRLDVKGGDLTRGQFTVDCPQTDKIKKYVLELKVVDVKSGKVICSRQQDWRIFPQITLKKPVKLAIALYDPLGKTAQAFKQGGLEFQLLKNLKAPKTTDLLVLGENSLSTLNAASIKSKLDSFVEQGGKVLVMAQQARVEDAFPYNPTSNQGIYWRANSVRIPSHPIAKNITNDDLRFWRGSDHVVSAGNYFKPFHGNALSIFDGGSMSGFTNSPLLEIPWGKGWYLLSQLKLTEKLFIEPVASLILNNILAYAATKPYIQCDKKLYYIGGESLRKTVKSLGADTAKLANAPNERNNLLLLVDAEFKPSKKQMTAVKQHLAQGGTVWLQGLTAANAAAWSSITGKVEFEKYSSSNLIKSGNPDLLPGISNSDIYWTGVPEYDFYGKEHEAFDMGQVTTNPPLPIKGAQQLLNHGALQAIKHGNGQIIVDSVNWSENLNGIPQRAPRIPAAIMTSFGIKLRPVPGDIRGNGNGEFKTVEIASSFNLGLNGTLPSGTKKFAGIPFKIKGNGLGAIMLGSDRLIQPTLRQRFKNRVDNITIGTKANRLYLLLTAYDSYESGRGFGGGSILANVKIEYANGDESILPIMQKVDCANLFETFGDLKRGKVVWSGLNPFKAILSKFTIWPDDEWIQTSGFNRIYATALEIPKPDQKITKISFISSNQHFVLIIFGVTVK